VRKKFFYPPSQKILSVVEGMNAKQFLLRRDFAPDEAQGEDTPGVSPRELHLLPVLALAGVVDTGYLTWEHFAGGLPACTTGIFADCGAVLASQYAIFLGVPLAVWGLIHYSLLFLTYFFNKKIFLLLAFWGFLFSGYLMYLQLGLIGALCLYCTLSALNSIVVFVISQAIFVRERKELIIWSDKFLYKNLIKHILFLTKPDFIHEAMLNLGQFAGNSQLVKKTFDYKYKYQDRALKQKVAGITFENPMGLAAGFDYEGKLTQVLPSLGFGFQTVGTVTNMPYEGNPPPRLGRLPKSKSLMVNKGFKSSGAKSVAQKLSQLNFEIPVGISIGRTNSPLLKTQKDSVADIVEAFKTFEAFGVKNSYYELNISCPNLIHDAGIDFYSPKNLEELLTTIDKLKIKKPIFIKMPIEKTDREVLAMLAVIAKHGPSGVIFGNLQKDRKHKSLVKNEVKKFPVGNFSGKPTWERSNELISLAYKHYKDRLVIIGCGGVFSAEDAYEKIKRGATLVQFITGMIFEGPQLATQINLGLTSLLVKDGLKNISEAVGMYHNPFGGLRGTLKHYKNPYKPVGLGDWEALK